jgi:GDP-L-fucose synthase
MNKTSKIYVAGHGGLVGTAIIRKLTKQGYTNVIHRSHAELDLTNQKEVQRFFEKEKPEYVFHAAGKVGGIEANSSYPTEFIYQNMMIGFNVVHASYRYGVKKLLNLGSSCIYPKFAPQPIKEEYLLSGPLETSNDAYALAKIAVIKLCNSYNRQYGTNFISAMPTNLYGPGDNYDLNTSHVLPAMIRRFHEAKVTRTDSVILMGDGSPSREFLFSDDLADAVVYLMEEKDVKDIGDFVNIGTGVDLTIKQLANLIKDVVYRDTLKRSCRINWDTSKPNGTPKKVLDISRITKLGWSPYTELPAGIEKTYKDFIDNKKWKI